MHCIGAKSTGPSVKGKPEWWYQVREATHVRNKTQNFLLKKKQKKKKQNRKYWCGFSFVDRTIMALYETIKVTFQRRHFLKMRFYDSYSIGFSQKKWKKIKKENARKIAESTFVTVIFKHFNQIVEKSIRILSSGYEQNPSFETFPQLSFPFVIFFPSQKPVIVSNNNPTMFNKSAEFFFSRPTLEKLYICIYKIDKELSFFYLWVIELSLISCSRIFLRKDSIFTLQYILFYYYYYQ